MLSFLLVCSLLKCTSVVLGPTLVLLTNQRQAETWSFKWPNTLPETKTGTLDQKKTIHLPGDLLAQQIQSTAVLSLVDKLVVTPQSCSYCYSYAHNVAIQQIHYHCSLNGK